MFLNGYFYSLCLTLLVRILKLGSAQVGYVLMGHMLPYNPEAQGLAKLRD